MAKKEALYKQTALVKAGQGFETDKYSMNVDNTDQAHGNVNLCFYIFVDVWYGKYCIKYVFLGHVTHIIIII